MFIIFRWLRCDFVFESSGLTLTKSLTFCKSPQCLAYVTYAVVGGPVQTSEVWDWISFQL